MRTNVRIEHVVLDGIELSRRERDALGPAIARELRRLADESAGRRVETQRRGSGSAVDGIAREVAAAVHRATAASRPASGPSARRGRG
jgi:hypothetical protein